MTSVSVAKLVLFVFICPNCSAVYQHKAVLGPRQVGNRAEPYQVLVIEEMDHSRCPFPHWHQVWGSPVQPQQAQRGALLHTVHGVPDWSDKPHD